MKNGDIIVIESVKELWDDKKQAVTGRIITDKAGEETRIKKGQGGKLQERWEWLEGEGIGKAIKLTVKEYKPPGGDTAYPYVADFEVVKDIFVTQATEKAQAQVKTDRNDSIERAVAVKEIGLDWREGKRKDDDILVIAREAWLINAINYKEAKGETDKVVKSSKETQAKSTDKQDSGEATEPKTIGGFLTWLKDRGIKSPRTWLEENYGVPSGEVLTLKKCQELYKEIENKEDK